MANYGSHGGFRWVQNRLAPGAPPPIVVRPVADAYGTKLCRGAPVKQETDGTMSLAATNANVFGIVDGVEQYYDGTVVRSGTALPASTTYGSNISRQSRVRVIRAAGQVFAVQVDDATTATTLAGYQAFVGENCDLTTGTNVGDESGCQIDISAHGTTAEDCRIEDIPNRETQDFTSSGVVVHVSFNLVQDVGLVSTTGV